jgi:hypothetical protein
MVPALACLSLLAPLAPPAGINTLSPDQVQQGWKLLFDGTTTRGWRSFGGAPVRRGWQVKEGVLSIVDPGSAGDIVTEGVYDWFELKIDFKLEKGQNSGIMFHVADSGEAAWNSGPEVQIYDHQGADWAQKTGWLYGLYSSTVETTKPIGEWNTFEIRIARDQSWVKVNGATYFTFKYHSEDFWARAKKSKFKDFPLFARQAQGKIGIQGDHGIVSFRNIMVKELD